MELWTGLDGTIIDYTGLEPIIDNTIVDDRVFTISTTGVDQQIRIRDDPDNNGYCVIDSNGAGEFESIAFPNPANSLTVNVNDLSAGLGPVVNIFWKGM